MIYYAIIGDVKDSRTLPNRNDVQEKLKNFYLILIEYITRI